MRSLAIILLLSAVARGVFGQVPEAIAQIKTLVWHGDPECCTQENHIAPNGVTINAKAISDFDVGLRVFASVHGPTVWVWLAVNPLRQMRVYALSRATLDIREKIFKPVDADKRIRSIQKKGAVRGVFTAIHGAKSTSEVEIQDQNGRPEGTATVTTRNEAETQRQLDQINRETAAGAAGYENLVRDYDALPGSSPWGAIDFEVTIKKPTAVIFRIQIGDTIYVLPFDLLPVR